MAKKLKQIRKLEKKLVQEAKKKHYKKKYTKKEFDEVAVNLAEVKKGKLTQKKDGGRKITSKKAAVAKGLNIADAKSKNKSSKMKTSISTK